MWKIIGRGALAIAPLCKSIDGNVLSREKWGAEGRRDAMSNAREEFIFTPRRGDLLKEVGHGEELWSGVLRRGTGRWGCGKVSEGVRVVSSALMQWEMGRYMGLAS